MDRRSHVWGLEARSAVPELEFDLVLSLHAGANRAPDEVGYELCNVGQVVQNVISREAGRNVTNAGHVLENNHCPDDAVVAFRRDDPAQ